MYYFAYGSNMLTNRLQTRVPSCRPYVVAQLPNYRLRFDKRGLRDGSGKCTIWPTPDTTVWGVVFFIDPDEKPLLDQIEGAGNGYEIVTVQLVTHNHQALTATTYLAEPVALDPTLKPFDWYHALVLAGAHEHELPAPYIAAIAGVSTYPDPDQQRAARHYALIR